MFSLGSMARTKQTPRNPNLERPTAAMGIDVQPERRVPLKPTSKKVATKGGKQPRKHLLHKLIRRNKSTTGGIKKPHRYDTSYFWFEKVQLLSSNLSLAEFGCDLMF